MGLPQHFPLHLVLWDWIQLLFIYFWLLRTRLKRVVATKREETFGWQNIGIVFRLCVSV